MTAVFSLILGSSNFNTSRHAGSFKLYFNGLLRTESANKAFLLCILINETNKENKEIIKKKIVFACTLGEFVLTNDVALKAGWRDLCSDAGQL